MASVQIDSVAADFAEATGADQALAVDGGSPRRLHRIRTVRRLQGISLRTAARQLGTTVSDIRAQEDEFSDLRLSELYKWQAVLEVPLEELLVEPNSPLSRPITERARLVRVMKTAAAILEQAPTPQLTRLAERLVKQLIELMPELQGVGPWNSVGRRRSLDELGRIAEQSVPVDALRGSLLELDERS